MREIAIASVRIPSTRRAIRSIDGLAASIGEVGLLNPITIGEDGTLVAGLHRLEACKALGWTRIPAMTLSLPDLKLRLAELDENLERAELSELERAESTAERKRLYEALHPGAARPRGGRPEKNVDRVPKFSDKAAKAKGVSERTVRREVSIAERIPEDVRDAIRSTPLADSKMDLLTMARLDEGTQRQIAHVVKEKPSTTLIEAVKQIANAKPNGAVAIDSERVKWMKDAERWAKALYELFVLVNSVRDNGGILNLSRHWPAKTRESYAERVDRLIELLGNIRQELRTGEAA